MNDDSLRRDQGLIFRQATVFWETRFPVAGERFDSTRFRVDPPYAMVRDVRDVDVVILVESDAVRIAKTGPPCRTVVAPLPGNPVASHSRDYTALGVDSPNEMILHLHDEHVAL